MVLAYINSWNNITGSRPVNFVRIFDCWVHVVTCNRHVCREQIQLCINHGLTDTIHHWLLLLTTVMLRYINFDFWSILIRFLACNRNFDTIRFWVGTLNSIFLEIRTSLVQAHVPGTKLAGHATVRHHPLVHADHPLPCPTTGRPAWQQTNCVIMGHSTVAYVA